MSSREYFEKVALQWDEMRRTFFAEAVREKAFRVAEIVKGRIAAEVGAGTGFMTEGLLIKGLKVIVVDQSAAMLSAMKANINLNVAPPSRMVPAFTA